MQHSISQEQVNFYQDIGYIIIEDFLSFEKLAGWRTAVYKAVDAMDMERMLL